MWRHWGVVGLESLVGVIALIALVGLVVAVVRQNSRLGLMEREIGALRSLVLSMPALGTAPQTATQAGETLATVPPAAAVADASAIVAEPAAIDAPAQPDKPEALSTPTEPDAAPETEAPPSAAPPLQPKRPDIETALGTRWAVWVGGIALALGGLFLVRYSIEAGLLGPAARLTFAAIFGAALVAAGEVIRRSIFRLPVEGLAAAYIPAILTAAGAFSLFGTVYAAHGIYGFIGPGTAFFMLGAIGLATLALALIHGQALAGIGLVGALATPLLVNSQAPNHWALFGYLAIVLVAAVAVSRIRTWSVLAAAAFAGVGLWTLLYMADAGAINLTIVVFISAVQIGTLGLVWLGRLAPMPDPAAEQRIAVLPAAVHAFFLALTALALLVDPEFAPSNGSYWGAAIIAAMAGLAAWRIQALPLLFAAGIAVVLAYVRMAFAGSFLVEIMGEEVTLDGFPPLAASGSPRLVGAVLGLLLLALGAWRGRAFVARRPLVAAWWVAFAGLVPLVVVFAVWFVFGDLDTDVLRAVIAAALALALVAVGEAVARAEEPPLTGGKAVSVAYCAAGAASVLALHMGFGSTLTTILIGLAAAVPSFATRYRTYPVLGWLSVGAAIVTLVRVASDPTIVGAGALSTTPVFNALLPGYGLPALGFAFAAWQLARTTAGRPRLIMEAAAALFALLTLAMLVRHAMNGGVIYGDAPTLAEQSIYSLIALGAGAILISLDMRSPSSVLRYGSLGIGVASVASIVLQHFLVLNPLFTEESTGQIPVFNLLFLAYLLPAIAAGALALYARSRRPRWYAAMLGVTAAALVFAYATLSVRRLFKGEFIGLWSGLEQLETYSYSALWLAMGVALLVVGVRTTSNILRLASGALIAIAVAKVFLFDMSELQGVLRALSFIGLGAVLIGIGLFYQRLLSRTPQASRQEPG